MKQHNTRGRIASRALAATALTAMAILAPTAANAATTSPATAATTENDASATPANDATGSCQVTGGSFNWGIKESFRSYISGSIANGSWEVADGATYDTPLFGFTNPTGEIDPSTGEGQVSFPGSVHFTGHDGVLDLTFQNPTIEFKGDGTARLLLDTRSNDASGELVLDEQQVSLAKVDGVDSSNIAGGEMKVTDAPAVLTSEGAKAFGDFYASGDEVDPLSFTLQFADCEGAGAGADAGEDQATPDEPVATAADESEAVVPWLPIIIGGVAVVVIGVTAGMLIAGRKKTPPPSA